MYLYCMRNSCHLEELHAMNGGDVLNNKKTPVNQK